MTPERFKEVRDYERNYFRVYRSEWRKANPDRERESSRKFQAKAYKADPVKHRQRAAAARYNITVPEYQALIARDLCDACHRSSDKVLEIDHDHATGLIRGVICHGCNSALGHTRDDIDRLKGLIFYLEAAAAGALPLVG